MTSEYIFRHHVGRSDESVSEIPECDVAIFMIPVEVFMC